MVSKANDFFDVYSPARILVVTVDHSLTKSLSAILNNEGFVVTTAKNGLHALNLIQNDEFELLIFDWKLPDISGIDLCRKLRMQNNQALIFLLSDNDSESDTVLGLEFGADDILIHPFGMREFVARCRALLRRYPFEMATFSKFECCDLELIPDECRACRNGHDLNLSPKEFKLLELFIQNPKRVWSRDELLDQVWGVNYIGDKKTVDVHIRWLREKIETNPSSPTKLFTVRGFGYRFC